jgi:hypothetical protein
MVLTQAGLAINQIFIGKKCEIGYLIKDDA